MQVRWLIFGRLLMPCAMISSTRCAVRFAKSAMPSASMQLLPSVADWITSEFVIVPE